MVAEHLSVQLWQFNVFEIETNFSTLFAGD
jgi:hypothetical protein